MEQTNIERPTLAAILLSVWVIYIGVAIGTAAADDPPAPERIDFDSYNAVPPKYWYAIYDGTYESFYQPVYGDLVLPPNPTAPVPAMVIMNDSGGVEDHHEFDWARFLARNGFAGFVVDSFSPRGVENTSTDQGQVTEVSMIVDAYQALDTLLEDDRIDPERIGLMGFSKGAIVTYLASWDFFHRRLAPSDGQFAAYLPIYAGCTIQQAEIQTTGAPILFLSGKKDNWTPLGPCQSMVDRMVDAGYDARLIAYDAHHAFDIPGEREVRFSSVLNWSDCVYFVNYNNPPLGFLPRNEDSWRPWDKFSQFENGCRKYGASIGYSRDAKSRARRDVKDFLTEVFGGGTS